MTWDAANKSTGIALISSIIAFKTSSTYQGVLATGSFDQASGGKYYYEIATGGAGTAADIFLGIRRTSDLPVSGVMNPDPTGDRYALVSAGTAYVSDQVTAGSDVPAALVIGNTMMIAVDYPAKRLWLGVNGTWANGVNPSGGTGGAAYGWPDGMAFSVAYVTGNVFGAPTIQLRTVAPFTYTVPSGFGEEGAVALTGAFWDGFRLTEEDASNG